MRTKQQIQKEINKVAKKEAEARAKGDLIKADTLALDIKILVAEYREVHRLTAAF